MTISKARLPKIYRRNGKECYLDPVRKRLIYITPEETVRQKMISFLTDTLKVPKDMILVEERLSHFGLDSKGRADIVVLGLNKDNECFPLTVIECKAPNVPVDERAQNQALDYSDALGSVYTLVITGDEYFCYKYDESLNQYILIQELPGYSEMLTGECVEVEVGDIPERIPYESLEKELKAVFAEDEDSYYSDISKYTPMSLAVPIFNLWECLLDTRVKMPKGDYGIFELIEDYGVRMLTYGNASGGQFYGPYRSFLVNINGSTEFFSIGISTYWKASWKDDDKTKHPLTCINVAHDNEKTSHHSLQLVIDEDAVSYGKTVRIYHGGRIAIGNIGSGKKSELREQVGMRYPKIIGKDKYYLGKINSDHLLRLDEPDVIDLVVNLISYSIVRDEFREIVKSRQAR